MALTVVQHNKIMIDNTKKAAKKGVGEPPKGNPKGKEKPRKTTGGK